MNTENGFISRDELRRKLDSGDPIIVVDVLAEDSYVKSHLSGSINIPTKHLREQAPEEIPDQASEVVVYCANPSRVASDGATDALRAMGYTGVFDYRGSKKHWREGGLPLDGGAERAVHAP